MGLASSLFGGSTTKTKQFQLPGIFGAGADSGRLARGAESLLGEEPDLLGLLRSELTSPNFAPQTSSEQSILSSIMDLTGGRSAARGLGAPTQGALAQSIAPTLVNQRNARVSNLAQALGLEQGFRGQTLGGLLELGTLAMPQNVFQPQIEQSGGILPGIAGIAGMASGLGGLGSLFKGLGGGLGSILSEGKVNPFGKGLGMSGGSNTLNRSAIG